MTARGFIFRRPSAARRDLAQLELFIAGFLQAHDGLGPTVREMAGALGFASSSTIARRVDRLVDLKRLSRLPGRSRALAPSRPVPLITAPDGAPLFFIAADRLGANTRSAHHG